MWHYNTNPRHLVRVSGAHVQRRSRRQGRR